MRNLEEKDFAGLKGKTILSIKGMEVEGEEIEFNTSEGTYIMFHNQDCCEYVRIIDVIGDVDNLLNSEILDAREESNEANIGTYTFYWLSTIKGSVNIRWLGTSNGYYSERVSFYKLQENSLARAAPGRLRSHSAPTP